MTPPPPPEPPGIEYNYVSCGDKVIVERRSLSQRFWPSGNDTSHAGSLFGCAWDAWAGGHPAQVSLKMVGVQWLSLHFNFRSLKIRRN